LQGVADAAPEKALSMCIEKEFWVHRTVGFRADHIKKNKNPIKVKTVIAAIHFLALM
jgi:hypothetical protein